MKSLTVPAAALVAAVFAGGAAAPARHSAARSAAVVANDNRASAGAMHGDTLDVTLEAREGDWKPYGSAGPSVRILAFGEAGKTTQTPGPMIRVRAGTHVRARVRNTVGSTLVVHGLSTRRAPEPDTLVVPAGTMRDVVFTADDQGTFFYWATTTGSSFANRLYEDSQ
ncbi:MAG: multicopper oxidase domain-containing protein, partial [Gemmatimonadales bacterium]